MRGSWSLDHDGANEVRSSPVELTDSTTAPDKLYMIAEIEHGEMTTRWKRSRCTPIAWATAALIGSAWETATTTPPEWRVTSLSTVVTMRVCISVNDSPSGKRKPLG